jgi:hypothetical protein
MYRLDLMDYKFKTKEINFLNDLINLSPGCIVVYLICARMTLLRYIGTYIKDTHYLILLWLSLSESYLLPTFSLDA